MNKRRKDVIIPYLQYRQESKCCNCSWETCWMCLRFNSARPGSLLTVPCRAW